MDSSVRHQREGERAQAGERLRLAQRMRDIAPFHVMELFGRARELEAAGRSIIHLEVGEPDFPTPEPIVQAGIAALRARLPYTQALGLPALREAISGFYLQRFGVRVDPACIAVTAGASGALLLALGVLVDPGDEIVLTDPGYPCNRQFVRALEGRAVGVPVTAASQYQLTADMVERAWSARTAGVLLATPANPTGTLVPQASLREIHRRVRARGGALIVDEIYQGLTYDGDPETALAFANDMFVINSFSKYFQMTGWRLGWLVVPEAYVREVEKLAQNLFICPSTPAQYAALAAFKPETLAICEERRAEFRARRDYLLPALRALGFGIAVQPQGAFYLYADCSRFTQDSARFASDMLEHVGVALTPGLDFGSHEPQRHVRVSYCVAIDKLKEAVQRLARFVERGPAN
jgi:aspartate/methionine/tyrosine aminotransferase